MPKVYKIAEAIYAQLGPPLTNQYEARLNEFFEERNAGCEMRSGKIAERPVD